MTSHHKVAQKQGFIVSSTNKISSITTFIDALKVHQKASKTAQKNEAENLAAKLLAEGVSTDENQKELK